MGRRVPQITDTVHMELRLAPQTEEWAEDLLRQVCDGCERRPDALVVTTQMSGNTSGIDCLADWLADVQEALAEGEIAPMEFDIRVWATPDAG